MSGGELAETTYRPLGRRAKWVTGLLVASIVIDLVAVVSGLMQRSLLADAASGQPISAGKAHSNDVRELVVGLVQGAVFILTGAAFLFWFYRAYRNLTALGASGRFRRGWAIGGWFVPFLNLWRPKQILNDIWRASDPDAPAGQATVRVGDSVPMLYLAWWLGYVFATHLYSFASRSVIRADETSEFQTVTNVFLAADVLSVITGVLALLAVHRLTTRQTARANRLGLVLEEDPRPVWWRKSAWAALLAVLAGLALQGLIAIAAWNGELGTSEQNPLLLPQAPRGAPPDALFADDFSQAGVWLVRDDRKLRLDYVDGGYRILVKDRDLWSSTQNIREEVDSMSAEVEATLRAGRVSSDFYGLMCGASSQGAYLFGISPDGYYTIAFDPGGDRAFDFKRLVEDRARTRFSADHEANRIRATCTRRAGGTRLRLDVNRTTVAETTHRRGLGRFVGVGLFAFSGRGGTDVRFDDIVVRDTSSP